MFGPVHYVPVLRSKEGELHALERLTDTDRGMITPMIELIPSVFRGRVVNRVKLPDPEPATVLHKHAKKFLKSCKYEPFFLDLQHLEGMISNVSGMHPLAYVGKYCCDFRLKMIPVTGLTRSDDFQAAVRNSIHRDRRGTCIRLHWQQVKNRDLRSELSQLLGRLGVSRADADLMIDYGAELSKAPPTSELLLEVPHLDEWRTLTVSTGTFPKDLQKFSPGIHEIPRVDWLNWQHLISDPKVPRRPTFSDYTVQYGEYVEPVPGCNPSASLRYTLKESWLIFRGEALRRKNKNEKGPGAEQWVGHAMLLLDSGRFFGANYSCGDEYIFTMSKKQSRPYGNPTTWIRAGLNHHMTVVSRQLQGSRAS